MRLKLSPGVPLFHSSARFWSNLGPLFIYFPVMMNITIINMIKLIPMMVMNVIVMIVIFMIILIDDAD